jgi:thymidylate synthase ThyX
MSVSAEVILDSVSPAGLRLTTFQLTFHRFVLAEFNTHRVFSRNSASSRAIPVQKQIDKVLNETAMPVEFGTNQSGMQAGPPLEGDDLYAAQDLWRSAAHDATVYANRLMDLGVHKQVTNRLLEPFMWHTAIVTSMEWDNFYTQRCSELAQPEIQAVAYPTREAFLASTPIQLGYGDWHTPYIHPYEYELFDVETRKKVSAARCARVSYLTQDGVRDVDADLTLYERLVTADPPHWSPLEHVATPFEGKHHNPGGNFINWARNDRYSYSPYGFAQLRHNPMS